VIIELEALAIIVAELPTPANTHGSPASTPVQC